MSTSSNSTMENNNLCFKYNDGVPFKFSWNLSKNSDEIFFEQITTSLINSLAIMDDQNRELKTIIQQKDAEIEQYKFEGIQLIRKNLETKVFKENDFDGKFQGLKKGEFVEFVKVVENRRDLKLVCGFDSIDDDVNVNVTKKTPIKETTIKPSPVKQQKTISRKFQPTNELSKPIVYDEDEPSQPKQFCNEPETPPTSLPEISKKKPKIRRDLNL